MRVSHFLPNINILKPAENPLSSFAIFALLELLRVPGTVSTLPGVQFQLVWIGHFGQNDSPKIIPDSPTQPEGGVVSEHESFGRTPKNPCIIVSALPKTNSKRT